MAEKKAMRETMAASEDKRSDKRIACIIPIPVHISTFDSSHSIDAQLVDHGKNGACIVSGQSFFPGSPIIYKVAYSNVNGAGSSLLNHPLYLALGSSTTPRFIRILSSIVPEGLNVDCCCFT